MYNETHLINTFLLKEEYNDLFKSLPENTSATAFASDGFSLCGFISNTPINKIKFIILEDYHSTKNVLVRYDVTIDQVLNEIKIALENNTVLPYRNKDNNIVLSWCKLNHLKINSKDINNKDFRRDLSYDCRNLLI